MNNKYKIIAIVLSVIGIGILTFSISYAFLIDTDSKTNTVGIATNKITVTEEFTPPDDLTPGLEIEKKPKVNNTGNSSVYVRAKVLFSDSRAKDFCDNLDIDTTNWIYNSTDGYYYYKTVVEAGKSTTEIFTKVKIKDTVTADKLKSFDILISCESVSGRASTYQEAWGL